MATFSKPTIVPNWATTTGNIAVPSAGRRNDGWLTNEKPPSDIENWNKRTTGEWLEWIDERLDDSPGLASTGRITAIAASLLVVGADTDTFILDDGVNPAVTFVFDDDSSVSVTDTNRAINHTGAESAISMQSSIITAINTAPTLAITASLASIAIVDLVNNATGVAGNVVATETVANAGFLISGMTGGVEPIDILGMPFPVTLAANKDVTLSGTGRYKHGIYSLNFHAGLVTLSANITFDLTKYFALIGANTTKAVLSIQLPVGKRITSVELNVFGGDGNDKDFSLQYIDTADTTPTLVKEVTLSASGTFIVGMVDINHVVAARRYYFLQMISSSGSTTDRFAGAEVFFDEP